ncbi:hypothetical protein [Actinoplanes aureus]|nr:hypothetical protein [Actinoplanes aureus]
MTPHPLVARVPQKPADGGDLLDDAEVGPVEVEVEVEVEVVVA